jgi:hypothetical protein
MSSGYHGTSNDSTIESTNEHTNDITNNITNDSLHLDDMTLSWPIEQPDQQLPYFYNDSGMPRSVQRDLAGIDLALANDGGFGPSVGAGDLHSPPLDPSTNDSRTRDLWTSGLG